MLLPEYKSSLLPRPGRSSFSSLPRYTQLAHPNLRFSLRNQLLVIVSEIARVRLLEIEVCIFPLLRDLVGFLFFVNNRVFNVLYFGSFSQVRVDQ